MRQLINDEKKQNEHLYTKIAIFYMKNRNAKTKKQLFKANCHKD